MISIYRKLLPDEVRWIKDLEEEIAHLKRTLHSVLDGGEDEARKQQWHTLKLTPSESRVLRLLLHRTFATREALWTALYWDRDEPDDPKILDVFLCKIRQKLPWIREHIKCKPHEGHYLTPEGKHRLLFELMNPGVEGGCHVV